MAGLWTWLIVATSQEGRRSFHVLAVVFDLQLSIARYIYIGSNICGEIFFFSFFLHISITRDLYKYIGDRL